MELSAILATLLAPLLLGLAPIVAVKDALARDCPDKRIARKAVAVKTHKPDCPRRRYILM